MTEKKVDWVKWGVVINFVMLIAILTTVFNISIPLPSFGKQEFAISTLERPMSPEILPALETSPLYYTELIVKTPGEVDYGDILKFSINIKDKGKKSVEEPEFRVFIVDSIGNVRGVYPPQVINWMQNNSISFLLIEDDIQKEEIDEGIIFNFKMPPEDQKVSGSWKIFVYLFDKSNESLVSYNVSEFMVTRKNSLLLYIGIIGLMICTGVLIFGIYSLLREIRLK
ncbi:MAG: hypothetical protein KAT65_29440 [Methanophagales archaeon]|nr:hypothetical protein [Methanophagales archaeon]